MSHAVQPSTRSGLIFRINMDTQWRQQQIIDFSENCCLHATCRRQAIVA
jgi:hypothetical protein